ncbi:hypothetical protein [Yaniella halotolerans]|uniref:hypothetical protein n=1 Tax=Yaniella halotolerans TaxID=225453 RepID=UPI0003B3B279|nr:hypothetical protein [Yaniella halotolerans]
MCIRIWVCIFLGVVPQGPVHGGISPNPFDRCAVTRSHEINETVIVVIGFDTVLPLHPGEVLFRISDATETQDSACPRVIEVERVIEQQHTSNQRTGAASGEDNIARDFTF